MKTVEYLDAIKARHSLKSDYALAKLLGLSTSAIYTYRAGRGEMDSTTAVKVAELLAINPLQVIACVELARAKNDGARKVWLRYAAAVTVAVLGALPFSVPEGHAGQILHNQSGNTHSNVN
jgi:predicted transcriptional regulator